MRKPVFAICEQQRRRSACASAQSDQHLCYSLPRSYNTSFFSVRNFKPLASLCGSAGRFESYMVVNPTDRFSRDEARLVSISEATNMMSVTQKLLGHVKQFHYRNEFCFCGFYRCVNYVESLTN